MRQGMFLIFIGTFMWALDTGVALIVISSLGLAFKK